MTSSPSIDWASLRTATGTAESVPRALRDLGSSDAAVRRAAYWAIDNHVVLQGDLYEAAPFVARGLVECLRSKPPSRAEIYDLLVELANGQAPETRTVRIAGEDRALRDATLRELTGGLELYWSDLQTPDQGTRRSVAALLLALSDDGHLDHGRLQHALALEPDEEVQRALREALDVTSARRRACCPPPALSDAPPAAPSTATSRAITSLSFVLDVDDGWPPVAIECLPFRPTPDGLVALAPPLFVRDLSVGDAITVALDPESDHVASWRHVTRSEHTTVWLLRTGPAPGLADALAALRGLSCSTVSMTQVGVYAVDVPASVPIRAVDDILARLDPDAIAVAFPSMRHPEPT